MVHNSPPSPTEGSGGQPMLGTRLAKPVRGTSGTTGASEDAAGDEPGVGHSTCGKLPGELLVNC